MEEHNFYLHVNQKWLMDNPMPDDFVRYGTFEVLNEENRLKVRQCIEEALDDRVRLLNGMIKNHQERNSLGLEGLREMLNRIDKIKNVMELFLFFGVLMRNGIRNPLNVGVAPDLKDNSINELYIGTGGLGLPERDYYLEDNKEITDKYFEFIRVLSKEVNIKMREEVIFKIEKSLASDMLSKVEKRYPENRYHPMSVSNLMEKSNLDWLRLLQGLGLNIYVEDNIILSSLKGVLNLRNRLEEHDLSEWKEYMKFHLIVSMGEELTDRIEEIKYNFYQRDLSGQKKMKDLWKREQCLLDSYLGELIGREYVRKYFDESSKEKALEMVNNLRESFRRILLKVDWMEEGTREKALEKLNKFTVKIGYPDEWENWDDLVLENDSLVENCLRINQYVFEKELKEWRKEIDRKKWLMTPHTINAYYYPVYNEIVFPAAILQNPFFDKDNSDGENYGGIGAVIGHEMTHGFDDQGRKFDGDGNLNDWWSEMDKERYTKRADKIKEQYNNYYYYDVRVNGELTLGENIADIGGLKIALDGLKLKYVNEELRNEMRKAFHSWAKCWRNHIRKEELIKRLKTDPHSPGELRVNGVVINLEEYYEVFGLERPKELNSVW